MEITLTTPALLFPAISLLLLAYTNRFLTLAALIRSLYAEWRDNHDHVLFGQLKNLRKRVLLIRTMQTMGIASLFLCVLAMLLFYFELILVGEIIFALSLVLLMISLGLSVYEIQISVHALDLQLKDLESPRPANPNGTCHPQPEQRPPSSLGNS
ncbi:DUF2721 domain-containing protein [Desulfuromonas acetoxidans]|uniref:II family cellulose-binding protein n=1 Tax=Desulfuromonas acetoxidans (strain DSM 684 / 11070) TaxID=281689 RepID=Q1K2R9_DESA6|nr:DUF2721 domain-containing protein [Desulfuromonas acetoxidans]EAT16812.1 conserved hypothetical protein [Desulfuromonas acetoxidans DSM 684]MBF0644640.1 DUF2721 domain-containing protein [Desulfuromonas acetoxidans]NVD23753.1 DUF2721 domain-containing protein [Desulfuromonas acetoxidans]NVE15850.1 DUF2721 domain-containing protein [Desulfuromonas acetoxidans]